MLENLSILYFFPALIFTCAILGTNVIAIGIIVTMKNIAMMVRMKGEHVQQGTFSGKKYWDTYQISPKVCPEKNRTEIVISTIYQFFD